MRRWLELGRAVSCVAALLLGCSTNPHTATDERDKSELRSLVVLYGSATSAWQRPPKSEEEFKKYVASQQGQMLSVLKVADAEGLFVSDRDGKPFIIQYAQPNDGSGAAAIAFEQEGVHGKRLVGFSSGIVVELDAAEFARQVGARNP